MTEQPDCAYYKVFYTEKAWLKQKTFNDGYLKVAGRRNGELFDTYFKGLAKTSNLEMNINDRQESECHLTGGKNKYLVIVEKQIDAQIFETLRNAIRSIPVQTKGVIGPGVADPKAQQAQLKQKAVEEEGLGGFVLCDVGTIGVKSKCWLEKVFAESLHPHQLETAQSIFNTLAGLAPPNTIGGQSKALILDDDPGLGKKIPLIGVLRTILFQSPYKKNEPLVNKVLILTPEDRLNQWVQEINEWIGEKKLAVNVLSSKAPREEGQKQVQKFENKFQKLMVASYEAIVVFKTYFTTRLDLMIWDDIPRLLPLMRIKSQLESFNTWDVRKKLILSSRPLFPVYACLPEIFACLSLVSVEGCKSEKTFKKSFAKPILKGKSPNATADEIEGGTKRTTELERILQGAMIKRSVNEIPIGSCIKEEVLFVRPTSEQMNAYNHILPELNRKLNAGHWGGDIRISLGKMNQVLVHPDIIVPKKQKGPEEESSEEEDEFDPNTDRKILASGKMAVINDLVEKVVVSPEKYSTVVPKLVIISEQKASLDYIRKYLLHRRINYCWVDTETSPFKAKKFAEKFSETNDTKVMLVLGLACQPKLVFPPGCTVILVEPYLDSPSPGLHRGRCLFAARKVPLPPTRFLRLVTAGSAEMLLLAYEQNLWSFSIEEDKPPTLAIPEDELVGLTSALNPDDISNLPFDPVAYLVAKSMCKPCKFATPTPDAPQETANTNGEAQMENVEQILAEMEGGNNSSPLTKILGDENAETAGNSENTAISRDEMQTQEAPSLFEAPELGYTQEPEAECSGSKMVAEEVLEEETVPILEVIPPPCPVEESGYVEDPDTILEIVTEPNVSEGVSGRLNRILESEETEVQVPAVSESVLATEECAGPLWEEGAVASSQGVRPGMAVPVESPPVAGHPVVAVPPSKLTASSTSGMSAVQEVSARCEDRDPETPTSSSRVQVAIKSSPLVSSRKPSVLETVSSSSQHTLSAPVVVTPPVPAAKKVLSGWNTPVVQVKAPLLAAGSPQAQTAASPPSNGMSLYHAFLKRSLAETTPENTLDHVARDALQTNKDSSSSN